MRWPFSTLFVIAIHLSACAVAQAGELPGAPGSRAFAELFATFVHAQYQLPPLIPAVALGKDTPLVPGNILSKAVSRTRSGGLETISLEGASYCGPPGDAVSASNAMQATWSAQDIAVTDIAGLSRIRLEILEPRLRNAPSDVRSSRAQSALRSCDAPRDGLKVITAILTAKARVTLGFRQLPSGDATKQILQTISTYFGTTPDVALNPQENEIRIEISESVALALGTRNVR